MLASLHMRSMNRGKVVQDRAVEVEENGRKTHEGAKLRPMGEGMHGKICGLSVSPQE